MEKKQEQLPNTKCHSDERDRNSRYKNSLLGGIFKSELGPVHPLEEK